MTQPTILIDADNIDDSAKKHILHDFIVAQTQHSIYKDPENFAAMDPFFEANKNMYNKLYPRSEQPFHMTLYVMLSIHLGIDKEKIEQAILDGDILDFAYECIEDTEHVKGLIANATTIHVTIDPATDEAFINPIH